MLRASRVKGHQGYVVMFEGKRVGEAFHLAGTHLSRHGLTNAYCRWANMLPACIQVCPVEIPGRGRRTMDNPIHSVNQLADALVNGLALQVHL